MYSAEKCNIWTFIDGGIYEHLGIWTGSDISRERAVASLIKRDKKQENGLGVNLRSTLF